MGEREMEHRTKGRDQAAEVIAREMGRAVHPWSLSYKPRVRWPDDYTPDERKRLEEGAWVVIERLEACGFKFEK